MPDSSFWFIAVMYSLVTYVHGHQGSHLVAIQSGSAELNPVLSLILVAYNCYFFFGTDIRPSGGIQSVCL